MVIGVNARVDKETLKRNRRMARIARPATEVGSVSAATEIGRGVSRRVLIVDLNNFAAFPTMSIGILTSSLRRAGHRVDVLCPLAYDAPAFERERCETRYDDIRRRMHLSTSPALAMVRDAAARAYAWKSERPHPIVVAEVGKALARKPDVVLLSAYLMHYKSVVKIAALAKAAGIPCLVGGPMFNLDDTARDWEAIDGVTAVVGAEVDLSISDLVESVCSDEDVMPYPGVTVGGIRRTAAPPLRRLESLPVPDYSDFAWDRYPIRIAPLMTGRGCQWDKCLFCSDVISAAARTFRTRPLESVLNEAEELSRRHGLHSFVFLDLKLNSWPDMMRGISEHLRSYVRGAEWVGTVHVDQRADNGLTARDLANAAQGGMRRISFGLESGSQRMLDLMRKGSDVERNSRFIRDAYDAGLSIRCSMFRGFPGETAEDMEATADFLTEHAQYLDRIRFSDFKLSTGTPIHAALLEKGAVAEELSADDARKARRRYRDPHDRAYRKKVSEVLDIVHQINRRHLRNSARQFDGVM